MKRLAISLFVPLTVSVAICAQSDIRDVDFQNFTYSAHCLSETPQNVKVRNGEFSEEKQEDGYVDRFYFRVFDAAYGDLNGDRRDEAIVLTICNTGGTGNFSEGFIFTMKAGKPSLGARIPGGDRAYGGLRTTRVENGLLVVESNDAGPDGGACCPQIIVTTKYKLAGGRIIQSGPAVRRDLYPMERVTFTKGSSGKTFAVTIPKQEGKRFVVAARAGQTLSVSINTDKASLRLLEDADVKFGENKFLVKLPKSGDFTIEVQNDSEAELTVTVNIKIQ